MSRQMIESSDRGITLDKKLAWTIGVALLAGGVWIGTQLASLQTSMVNLTDRQTEDRTDIRRNTSDISAMQAQNQRIESRLTIMGTTLERTDANVSALYDFLIDNEAIRLRPR